MHTARRDLALGIIEQLVQRIQQLEEEVRRLKDEVAEAKGEKKRPKVKPSKLDQRAGEEEDQGSASAEPPASRKRAKTAQPIIHEDKVIQPEGPFPPERASRAIGTSWSRIASSGPTPFAIAWPAGRRPRVRP